MKRIIQTLSGLLIWGAVIPGIASGGIMLLWNSFLAELFGLGNITYWQAAGLFFCGQLLSGGFIIGLIFLGGFLHKAIHHPDHRLRDHWHRMSDEQRREFIERRRQWFDMMHHTQASGSDERK